MDYKKLIIELLDNIGDKETLIYIFNVLSSYLKYKEM